MILVIYYTKKGYKYRLVQSVNYELNEETSMGWVVVGIYYYFKDRFYVYDEYYRLMTNDYLRFYEKRRKKDKIIEILESIRNVI